MDNVEKEREYRARTVNIGGFALMAPLGHFIIDPMSIIKQFHPLITFGYFISVLFLFMIGLWSIEIGRDILYRRR